MNYNVKFTGERFIPSIDDIELKLEHLQRYLSVCHLAENKVVLDVACGEGYGTNILAEKAGKVIGIDIDEATIEEANLKYVKADSNITFLNGNIKSLPLDDKSIDLLISFETIEHVGEDLQKLFLNEIARVLKDDGILIISTPNKKQYSDLFTYHNEFHIKEFYKEEFINFINTKFKNIKLYNQFFEVASFIVSQEDYNEKKINYKNDNYLYDGKYFILIASNIDISKKNISSVFMNNKQENIYNIKRLLDLQSQVEERNKHVKNLDLLIQSKNDRILQLQKEVEERNIHLNNLDKQIENLDKHIKQLEEKICIRKKCLFRKK